jgi:hypothetical protein
VGLFKYLPPGRAEFVETFRLRYTQPAAFNDPFEAKPYYTGVAPAAWIQASYPRRYEKVLREQYLSMPTDFQLRVSYSVFAWALEYTREDIYAVLRSVDESFVQPLNEIMHETFGRKVGALSLSETNDNQLMWSHYADSHRGFVVEFDESHSYFTGRAVSHDDLWQLQKVIYAETRPQTTPVDFDMTAILLTKHASWSYEREWKDFRPLNLASRVIEAEPLPIHLFDFPPTSIQSITLGAHMAADVRDSITSSIKQRDLYPHVRIFESILDVRDYALRFQELR